MIKDRINYGYLLAYFLFFLIFPPIIALPVVIFMVWMKKTPKYNEIYVLDSKIILIKRMIKSVKLYKSH